ncbi:hypothetical protein [Geosporobacter ferrireducens]|nr:hypothetical protein [Geosporobacter ferrireducens]
MPRIKSKSGIYHSIMRGINRQTVFGDGEDYHRFISNLTKVQGD